MLRFKTTIIGIVAYGCAAIFATRETVRYSHKEFAYPTQFIDARDIAFVAACCLLFIVMTLLDALSKKKDSVFFRIAICMALICIGLLPLIMVLRLCFVIL